MRGVAVVAVLLVAACSAGPQASAPAPTVAPTGASTASPSTPSPVSSAALTGAMARDVATTFEQARAGGSWGTAWAMLAPYSQRVIGSLAAFAAQETAFNAQGGAHFSVRDPTRDPGVFSADFLGNAFTDAQATSDFGSAWLVFVQHPDVQAASGATTGLLVAPVDGTWLVWIAH